MAVRAIRGATQVDADDREQVLEATRELVSAVLERLRPVPVEPEADDAAETPTSRLDTLVRAALGGEARAHDRLLEEIHPFVLRYCRGRLGRRGRRSSAAGAAAASSRRPPTMSPL